MFGISVSSLQTAVPAVLAVLTGLIGFLRHNNKAGRLRSQIKDTLELSKLAEDSKSPDAKVEIDELAVEQISRLRDIENKGSNRQYNSSTLVGALVVVAPLGFAAWGLFTLSWPPAAILAWLLIVISVVFLIIGTFGFFKPTPEERSA